TVMRATGNEAAPSKVDIGPAGILERDDVVNFLSALKTYLYSIGIYSAKAPIFGVSVEAPETTPKQWSPTLKWSVASCPTSTTSPEKSQPTTAPCGPS